MSVLKLTSCIACLLCIAVTSDAQVLKNIGKKIENKVNQRVDRRVDEKIEDELDKVDGKNAKVKKDEDGDVKIKTEDGSKIKVDADDGEKKVSGGTALAFNSKYDFVPGEKIVAYEDFGNTEIGDFPTRWNTNATAEVVTLNSKSGKWLKLNKEGVWHPEFITNLPENYTLEFDLGVNNDFNSGAFYINTTQLKSPEDYTNYYYYINWRGTHAIQLQISPGTGGTAHTKILAAKDGNYSVNNDVDFKTWNNKSNNFAHVSLWRQNQRLRVYVNGEKIWDLPRAFDATTKYNAITLSYQGGDSDDYYLVGNIRLAAGAPETRNKLITEGKFVTRGILFDVNSDKIKPESFGVLKEIANVLKENSSVKVKIVGHTDADGDDKSNMDLSARRAAAVKSHLVKEFGISADNLTTEGKGESQPVDKNDSVGGKANNRRVEFIKS